MSHHETTMKGAARTDGVNDFIVPHIIYNVNQCEVDWGKKHCSERGKKEIRTPNKYVAIQDCVK